MRADINDLPPSIQAWISVLEKRASWEEIRSQLSPDIVYVMAGRKTQGLDAVLQKLVERTRVLQDVKWQLISKGPATDHTVRATARSGVIQGGAGPLSAIDILFKLDGEGRIAWANPLPHHIEPMGLRAPIAVGELAPAFTLPDINGQAHSVSWESAKATLVIFSCNRCPWALGWHARLQRVASDYAPKGVHTVQINSNDPKLSPYDGLEHSRARVAAGEFATPLLVDEGQVIARLWGARHTPELFLISNTGRVAYHGAADADSEDENLAAAWARAALDQLLAGQPVTRASTTPVGCTIKWTF